MFYKTFDGERFDWLILTSDVSYEDKKKGLPTSNRLGLWWGPCCVLFVFVLCLVYPMLPVSMDCLFFIAPSFFSNVYLHHVVIGMQLSLELWTHL